MKNKYRGFTLVELICTLAIISITVAIAVPDITAYIEHSKKSNCEAVMRGIINDIRYSSLSKRYENEYTLNEKIENIISSSSDIKVVYYENETADGYLINSCSAGGICPNDNVYKFNWIITSGSNPENIILKFTYSCACDTNEDKDNKKIMTLNVAVKELSTMEYYNNENNQ